MEASKRKRASGGGISLSLDQHDVEMIEESSTHWPEVRASAGQPGEPSVIREAASAALSQGNVDVGIRLIDARLSDLKPQASWTVYMNVADNVGDPPTDLSVGRCTIHENLPQLDVEDSIVERRHGSWALCPASGDVTTHVSHYGCPCR